MDVTIIGYGKMGKEIEKVLLKRGHTIINILNSTKDLETAKKSESVCIDFTSPSAFEKNYILISEKFKSCVVGTTGWYKILDEVKKVFNKNNSNLVYGSNFSVGVNVLFEMTDYASKLFSKLKDYDSYILELHHKEKKDSPSGTAITIKEIIEKNFNKEINVSSVRSGNIKGIHDVGFESGVDKINIRHEAYSREGFAYGAVLAAEWVKDIKGIKEFKELFKQKIL